MRGLVALFTMWGFLLRLYGLGSLSIWLDEAISVLAAKQVAVAGVPLLPSGWLYLGGLPHTYVLGVWGWLVGVFTYSWTEFLARLPSVVMGTALIPLAYVIGKDVWNERVGIALAAFFAFNTWMIAWSRQARMYIFLVFFVIMALWALWKAANNGSLLTAAGWVLLAIVTHKAALVLFIPLAYLTYQHEKLNWRHGIVYATLVIVAASSYTLARLVTLSPYLWQYVSFLGIEYPLAIIGIFGVFMDWKERWLVGLGLGYVLLIGVFLDVFAYRYLLLASVFLVPVGLAALEKYARPAIFAVAVVVLLFISSTIIPTEAMYLEPGTPQPPWREVYTDVMSQKNVVLTLDTNGSTYEEAIIVDAHPVIADFYNVSVDGWLNNSLTGKAVERTTDAYLGLPIMEGDVIIVDERASKTATFNRSWNYTEYGNTSWRIARVYRR